MSVAEGDIAQGRAEGTYQSPQPMIVLMRFLSELWGLRSVRKTAWSTEEGQAELWVMMSEEHLEDQERIHLLKRAYRRDGLFPIDVHVINLARVSEQSLPAATVLFAR